MRAEAKVVCGMRISRRTLKCTYCFLVLQRIICYIVVIDPVTLGIAHAARLSDQGRQSCKPGTVGHLREQLAGLVI